MYWFNFHRSFIHSSAKLNAALFIAFMLTSGSSHLTVICIKQIHINPSLPLYAGQLLIYQKLWSMTLFTILMWCSRKKGFRHLITFIIKALKYTYVPSRLAHFTHSASIVWKRKTQRSLVRGRGTFYNWLKQHLSVVSPFRYLIMDVPF